MKYGLISLTLLVGCQQIPEGMTGARAGSIHLLSPRPAQAATCIARNIDRTTAYETSIHLMDRGFAVVSRSGTHNIAVAYLEPHPRGSRVTYWVRPAMESRDNFLKAALEHC